LREGEYLELPLNFEGQKIDAMGDEDRTAYYQKLLANGTDEHVYNITGVNITSADFDL